MSPGECSDSNFKVQSQARPRRWCRWSSCSLPRSQEPPEATTPRELAGKKGRIQVERISPPWFRRSQGRVRQRKLTGGLCSPLSHREIPSGAVGKEIKFLLPPGPKDLTRRQPGQQQKTQNCSVVELMNICGGTSDADWSKLETEQRWTEGRARRWRPVKLHL